MACKFWKVIKFKRVATKTGLNMTLYEFMYKLKADTVLNTDFVSGSLCQPHCDVCSDFITYITNPINGTGFYFIVFFYCIFAKSWPIYLFKPAPTRRVPAGTAGHGGIERLPF